MRLLAMKMDGELILNEMSDGLERSGAQIAVAIGLSSGRLYPALARLERLGELTSRWADEAEPRRRLYRIAADV